MHRFIVRALASLALASLLASVALAQCPDNPATAYPGFPPSYPAVPADPQAWQNKIFSFCHAHPPLILGGADDCSDRGEYNLHAGTTHLEAAYYMVQGSENEYYCAAAGGLITMPVSDNFTLTGPLSAVPISIEARLRITGSRTAGPAVGRVSFVAAADSVVFDAPVASSIDQTVVLHLSQLPGQPFVLLVRPAGTGFCQGYVILDTRLTFALPPGYLISSCHGYAGAVVTPVTARSWGSLKTSYR